jgi:hypothetical protein
MSSKIGFIEDGHIYFYEDLVLSSTTTYLSKFSDPFDPEYQSLIYAYKQALTEEEYKRLRSAVFGFDFKPPEAELNDIFIPICGDNIEEHKNHIKYEWSQAGPKGTAFHKERELESHARGYEINPWDQKQYPLITFDKKYDNEVYDMDLSIIPDGFYTEFLVYDKALPLEKAVCGTIDLLWIETVGGVRYSDTGDYKTNSKKPEDKKFSKMKPPLNHLYQNKISDYSLQGSWYQEMMRSHGFTPRRSSFTWYEDYDVNKSLQFDFLVKTKEINLIRDYIKSNKL